jgi:signal transduction histidine kinase/ligand-binding sensor domain-containing protein/DNA-binding response OmpR family regulator
MPLSAQNGTYYSTENGLSSSLVNDIYQDSFGFIWTTTEYGLNRFDGLRFTTYRHDDKNPNSVADNYVHVVFEDAEKHLWIGSLSGLMQYNHESDTFNRIALLRDSKRVSANVTQVKETKDGKIWITTSGQGMFVMGNGDTEAQSLDRDYPKANPNYQSGLVIDDKQRIWVGTEGEGLVMIDPASRHAEGYKADFTAGNHIQCLGFDAKGTLFAGTQNGGLLRFDGAAGKLVPVPYAGSNPSNSIFSLCVVNDQLLVGTDGQGIKIYNADKQCLEDYSNHHAPLDMTHGKVHALRLDREGNLWVGLFQKGIVRVPSKADLFTYYGSKSALYNPLGDACIMALCASSNGHLWVGADNDGLYELDADGNRVRHYEGHSSPNAPNTVLSVFEDSQHTLWVGSYNQGITRLNPATGQFTQLADSLKDAIVYSIAEGKDKTLYIALFGKGFLEYKATDRDHTLYHSAKGERDDRARDALPDDWINALYADKDGWIWIGHYKGVSCFNPENETFLTINRRNSLTLGCVGYTFTEDSYGNIWAGTSDGLYRYNKKSGQTTHFTETDGLANNVVCGLAHDDQGNVWATTYNGLSKYDAKSNRFINYFAGDGLQGNDFTHGACFTDSKGIIYFGGPGGVTVFDPKRIQQEVKPSKVYVTDFFVHNQPVYTTTLSGGKPIVDVPVPHAKGFRVAYEDNTIGLTFSTMTFDHPEQIVYKYRLDEQGDDWSETEPGVNRITFHNLSFGRYTLRVCAVDHGNESEETVLPIVIEAPWYASWWAIAIYFFLFIMIVWIVIGNLIGRSRNQRNQLKAAHAEQLSEAKMQFFINISHEIRTPMTLIISPVEKLLKQASSQELHQTYLMIYRNAQRILNLINQLLDIGKLDKGQMRMKFRQTDLVAFIQDVMQPFEYLAQRKHIRFVFSHVSARQIAWVDGNNFDKVLVNILSNAFKFTPDDGEIVVRMQTGHDERRDDALTDYIEISITDSGVGVEKDQLERIFERFYQADNELGAGQFGTGVGLHLTHTLVKMHHGEIHAENRESGTGTRFVIRIPQGHEHIADSDIEKGVYETPSQPAMNGAPAVDPALVAASAAPVQAQAPAAPAYQSPVVPPAPAASSAQAPAAPSEEEEEVMSPAARRAAARRRAAAAEKAAAEGKSPVVETAAPAPQPAPQPAQSQYSYAQQFVPVPQFAIEPDRQAPRPTGGALHHILVVDDEDDIRDYLQMELSESFRVDVCCNGKEAYDFILKEQPDLVVSDVMMPVMDGNTLCRKLKRHPQTNHIPIILLTAKAQANDRVEGLECGADSFITKPFNVDVLRSTISNLIDSRRVLKNKFSGAQEQEDKVEPVKVRPADDKFMDRVMPIINAHMADTEFNVEALCTELGLSRVHVHRKLKEITNLSTANFIKQVRLQQAAKLLSEDKLNVSEVAYAVGYGSLSHFSVAFHEMYGMSPKEYMHQTK